MPRRTRSLLGIGVLVLLGWRPLGVAALTNQALLLLLWSSTGRAEIHGFPPRYPPILSPGNTARLHAAVAALERVRALEPESPSSAEHLAEALYAVEDDAQAAEILSRLIAEKKLREALFVEGQPIFHLLRSRVHERSGRLTSARDDVFMALRRANFQLGWRRERLQLKRVSELSTRLVATAGRMSGENAYEAIVAAACAADWNGAGTLTEALARSPTAVQEDQRNFAMLVATFAAVRAGGALESAHPERWTGRLAYDQWTEGLPFLFLGRKLEATGLDRCSVGPLDVYQWFSATHGASAQGLYLEGSLYYWRGDPEGAVSAAAAGLQRDPRHAACRALLAFALEGAGKSRDAESAYVSALNLTPGSGELWARLGSLLHQQKRDAEANTCFERALALAPVDDALLVMAGAFFLDRGENARAQAVLRKAAVSNPRNEVARRLLRDSLGRE